ncbi:MAG TPA: TIGR04282 family arsenosugar biosynthesis glycosyltransferase [Acidocella sp.]|nr:TIGR04282 family arsenosugar biosynthesis glycosyltransferase [Acidocella sp.]
MTEPRLVLFTRFPTPGQAKTRLIPALGAEGAAALHRRLTERTLVAMHAAGLPIELLVTGAPLMDFHVWLGETLVIKEQGEGDLGARLARAAEAAPVILLGADAPDLSPAHLRAAAEAVRRGQVVIGPAEDGGYWLLGLPMPALFLFDTMPWSTDVLLAATLDRLLAHGIVPILLDRLADLDRPEDLARWPELTP